jgi:hypothetical protein
MERTHEGPALPPHNPQIECIEASSQVKWLAGCSLTVMPAGQHIAAVFRRTAAQRGSIAERCILENQLHAVTA